MSEFSSPLGLMVRGHDKYGSGAFGASRSGGTRQHLGFDLCVIPGQPILLPAPLKCVRVAIPYADGVDNELLRGILLEDQSGQMQVKILYVNPISKLMGGWWPRGTVIGSAQSLQRRYPGITDHIHVEVWLHGQRVDPGPYFFGQGVPM